VWWILLKGKCLMWLKDRVCLNCGSSLVQWRHKEPHCFNCGANVPFEELEIVEIGVNLRLVDFHEGSEEEDWLILNHDPYLMLARALR
jgi:hypothetical protein